MTVWVPDRNSRQTESARRPVVDARQRPASYGSAGRRRRNPGLILLSLIAAVLVLILISDLAVIGSGSQSISTLNSRIGRLENTNIRIRNEIDQNMDLAVINATAVKQDLISSRGVTTISLTAPDNMR